MELTVITKRPWIRAIIKCESWTKASLGMKCFLEHRLQCTARVQSMINSREDKRREGSQCWVIFEGWWEGVERGYFYFRLYWNTSKDRSAEHRSTSHTTDSQVVHTGAIGLMGSELSKLEALVEHQPKDENRIWDWLQKDWLDWSSKTRQQRVYNLCARCVCPTDKFSGYLL